MRWLVFIFALLMALILQTFLSLVPRIGDWRPDVILILLLFVSLWAPAGVTLFAALISGALQDVATGTFGPFAFGYAMIGFMMLRLRLAVYREHPLSHVAVALAASALMIIWLWLVLRVMRWLIRLLIWNGDPAMLEEMFLPSWPVWISTILFAPFILWFLQKTKKSFGFKSIDL